MSIHNLRNSEYGPTHWLCLGDRATAKSSMSAIVTVLVNDGKSLTDKSIGVTFETFDGKSFHWNFKSAAQLNAVLDELGLEYHPTTETGV